MSLDIGDILKDWPHEPGQLTVRKIRGADGKDKIQLRLDLGLLQMEVSGRPDGQRPHGCESLLEYHQNRLRRYKQQHGDNDDGFKLSSKACELLRAEGMMYYHRYVAEFVLEDFDAVERDTTRNLRLMDLLAAYAADSSDRYVMEQHRPYVLMMRARARCQRELAAERPREALKAAQDGLREIEEFYKGMQQEQAIPESAELAILNALTKEVRAKLPVDPMTKLTRALAKAVEEERYEDAAELRDRMKKLSARRRKAT